METWVHLAQTVVAALFLAGFWFATREGRERATATSVSDLKKALDDKADCDAMTDFAKRTDEDLKRGRIKMDKLLDELTTLQADCRGERERMNGIARHVDDIHRRVFNAG